MSIRNMINNLLLLQELSIYFCFYSFLIYYMPNTVSPAFPFPTCSLPQIHPASISSQKRAGISEPSTKHCIICYYKTRHILSNQGGMRQPNRRKMVPQVGKRPRDSSSSHCQEFDKNTKQLRHNKYADDLCQIPTVFLISASLPKS